MNHESASVEHEEIFRQQKVSFEIIPHQSKLFVDYQTDSKNLTKFYHSKNKSLKDFSNEVLQNYQTDRESLCNILIAENKQYDVGEKTFENIEKLREKDCVAVLTGQQAGLFSGASYTIYKALSAIKLAEDLTKKGIKAVPIFWIASEDHDFAEISKTFLVDNDEQFAEISSVGENSDNNLPIGFIETDENIKNSIKEFIEKLPKTEFTGQIDDLLNVTYKPNEIFSVAFGKLLAKIFREFGLIFVSPLNEDLRKLCTPIYQKAIENAEKINAELLKRNEELKEADYHSQVLVEKDFFPFFYIDENNERSGLRFDENKEIVQTQDGKNSFTKTELLKIASENPEKLSPSALMRPIIQDFLFPTICYFGGGAEIAYFAQNSVIYETLDRPQTPIRHRASFTIVQGKHRRTLEKYNLKFKDLFRGKEKIKAEIVEKFIDPETAKLFDETEKVFYTHLERLERNLKKDEPTLSDNLQNRQRKILWHIETLRKKFQRAEILKNEVINRRIESLFVNTLPYDVLQERYFTILYFMNIYGENLIEWLYSAVDSEEKKHQIIIF